MPDNSASSKRIAKNTLLLYIRMFVMMAVSLFTSRVVLQALGEVDYGIYNVIGGVVVLFSFLNGALLQATQRFLNFELGKNEGKATHMVFCMSMNAYLMLALIFIVLAETGGLWFVNTGLNIPMERMNATNWVYQFAILTFVINLIRVPYNATIIAYEKMDFFSYLSLIEAGLKLLVVYLLYITSCDRLILFAVLYTLTPTLITWLYKLYCNKHFSITRYHLIWDRGAFRKLFSFSGWSLFGNLANVFASQGLNVLVNIFCGIAVNAALGIANQISAKVMQFVTNFQMAFNPQIIKKYAADDKEGLYKLIFTTSKLSYYLLFVISLPLIIKMDVILNLWLVDVPQYTSVFSQLILIFMLIEALSGPLWMFVQATGKIKNYQLLMGGLIFLNFPLAYLVLLLGLPVYFVWVVKIFVNLVVFSTRMVYIWRVYGFPIAAYVRKTILPVCTVTLLVLPIPTLMAFFLPTGWYGFSISIVISLLVSLLFIYYCGLNSNERRIVTSGVTAKIHVKAWKR